MQKKNQFTNIFTMYFTMTFIDENTSYLYKILCCVFIYIYIYE